MALRVRALEFYDHLMTEEKTVNELEKTDSHYRDGFLDGAYFMASSIEDLQEDK